jgi:hypothetical protein
MTIRVTRGEQHTLTSVHWNRSQYRWCKRGIGKTVKVILRWIRRRVQVRGSDSHVMRSWMVLGEIVSAVGLSFAPINLKLPLANAIPDPVKAHINCLGSFLFHGRIFTLENL